MLYLQDLMMTLLIAEIEYQIFYTLLTSVSFRGVYLTGNLDEKTFVITLS